MVPLLPTKFSEKRFRFCFLKGSINKFTYYFPKHFLLQHNTNFFSPSGILQQEVLIVFFFFFFSQNFLSEQFIFFLGNYSIRDFIFLEDCRKSSLFLKDFLFRRKKNCLKIYFHKSRENLKKKIQSGKTIFQEKIMLTIKIKI